MEDGWGDRAVPVPCPALDGHSTLSLLVLGCVSWEPDFPVPEGDPLQPQEPPGKKNRLFVNACCREQGSARHTETTHPTHHPHRRVPAFRARQAG